MDGWVRGRFHPLDGGGFAIERAQDVGDIIDRNKAFQNDPQLKSDLMGHHMMTIPNVIIEKWINEEGFNILDTAKHGKKEIEKFIRRKYNDPDWRFLRTR